MDNSAILKHSLFQPAINHIMVFQQLFQLFLSNIPCKLISSCQSLKVMISQRFVRVFTSLLQTFLAMSFNFWLQLSLLPQAHSFFFSSRQTSSSITHVECLPLLGAHSGLTTPLLEHLLNEYISVYTGQLGPVLYSAMCL